MSVAVVLAVCVSLIELVLAAAVFVSIAAPERSFLAMDRVALPWRLFALLSWSVLTGMALQLGGAGVGFR